ncbi:MAG: cation transporter [Marmoricola sp.]|nr:cation transporter [Marmoricola sp.]
MGDQKSSRDDGQESSQGSGGDESARTVLLAGSANLAIAIAKLVGGLVSGSTAMLAEAAHSFADTLNQVFLMAALKRSKKPADTQHPFGYGMERYFWSLIAAVGIFVLGAGYSIYEGITSVLHPEELGGLLIPFAVLALSFLFEGASWLKAVRQLHGEAKEQGRGMFEHLRITPDPTAKTVAFEDTAALIGIVLAAAGIALHHFTDQGFWDGAASILIGLLLVVVAYALGQQNKSALIGEALTPEAERSIRGIIDESPGIDEVVELLTMRLSPEEVLVAARVDLDDHAEVNELELAADEVERRLKEKHPEVRHVFLDPTDVRQDSVP